MSEKSAFFIGTSGWSFPDWSGYVYPKTRPRGFSELSYLAGFFDAVELNMSFYRPPTDRMAATWVQRVSHNPTFRFTAKLWQRFTHERTRPWSGADAQTFKQGLQPLREAGRMGALLIQFPWSFAASPANRDWLERISAEFADWPRVVEVRHASWAGEENFDYLRTHGLNFCNIDQPASAKGIGHTSLATGPLAYYRFHGRNREAWFSKDAGRDQKYNYLYSATELDSWVADIAAMEKQVEQVYVMTNNHYRGQAAVNALQIKSRLSGKKVAVPEPLLARYPVLKDVAAPFPAENRDLF